MRRTPTACTDFRELLERALCEPAAELQPLSWHEHLNACPECRRVLEEEEALEYLLASLPAPQLPEALIERVLARLRGEHETGGLDTLLDLDHLDEPAGLPDRVLSELELDRLLARVPEIEPPAGLGAGVLAVHSNGLTQCRAEVFKKFLTRFSLGIYARNFFCPADPPIFTLAEYRRIFLNCHAN